MPGTYVRRVWQHDPSLYAPARYRRACAYEAFVPGAVAGTNPMLPAEVAAVVADAEREIVELDSTAARSRTLDPLARLLLRTESIASSRIEGLHADARAVARAEVGRELRQRVSAEADEVLGNVDAMSFAIEDASRRADLGVDDVVAIHRVLIRRSPAPAMAGQVRERQNWIGGNDYDPCGADFVPPPPEHVPGLLEDLCTFAAEEHLSPLVHAALVHAQFETIHPFADGNGRTGRALVHVVLRRRGLARHFVPPVSVPLAARRDTYIAGLTAFRRDRVPEWLESFASATVSAARLSRRYLDEVHALQDSWRERVRARARVRADAAVWAVVDVLPGHPVVSVPILVSATRRSKPGVSAAVTTLEGAGVLVPVRQGPRNRMWEAADLLDLVDALERAPL